MGRRSETAGLCGWVLLGVALILPACGDRGHEQVGHGRDGTVQGDSHRDGHEQAVAGIQELVDAGELSLGTEQTFTVPPEVLDLYRARGHRPLWVNDAGLTSSGGELLEVLRGSLEEGLPAHRYHIEVLDGVVQGDREGTDAGMRQLGIAELEVALTSMYVRYATDLARGHLDSTDDEVIWLIPRPDPPGGELLERLERGESPAGLLDDLRPTTPQYGRLMASLQHYRQVQEAGGWPRLPDDVNLREGDEGEDVMLLRRRLLAEGDPVERDLARAESSVARERFDGRLREAVEHVQARFALQVDGVVGGRTLHELNTPVSQRLFELEMNLERWRWLPHDLGARHILVNVAGYEMEVVNEGRRVLFMDVVVGEEGWETPVFRDTLDHIVFNPYWNVPASIAESSLLPEARNDPSYLERNNFEIVDRSGSSPRVVGIDSIDWSEVDAADFPYWLRQRPGPDNALGLVKFMFPNEHSIYLHDAPSQHLFLEARRAYSHGCVRVGKPFELARLLLEIDSDASDRQIGDFLDEDGERRVDLNGTVPIYIVYLTAWIEDDGRTRFHHDPYHRDRRMGATVPQ